MKIECIGSGSSGNCYKLSDGATDILIECGLTIKRIQQACGFKLSSLEGCIISHRHGDHIKGLLQLLDKGVDCYIGQAEKEALIDLDDRYQHHRLKGIQPLELFNLGTFAILPFQVEHDTECPLGYLIQSELTGDKLLFATDTYYVRYKFKGLTHLLLECNNSLEIMERNVSNGSLNGRLKQRIEKSHFSLENVVEFLKSCDLSKLEETYLIHLSDLNSDEQLFKEIIQKTTGKPVYVF